MRPVCPPQCDICFSRVWDKFPVCLLRNGNRAERGEAPRLTGWEGNSPLFGGTGRDGNILEHMFAVRGRTGNYCGMSAIVGNNAVGNRRPE